MTVLVTGGTGFVGLNLLHATDRDAVVLVRPGSPTRRLPDGVDTVVADLADPDSLATALEGVDSVVHLAAAVYDEARMHGTNVSGTERLVAAAGEAGVERFVFTSTVRAHPDVPGGAGSTYERSKVATEDVLFDGEHPFSVSAVYPTYIFGPRDFRMSRYEHVRPVASNRVLLPPLYTHDTYNVVHVNDVVDTIGHCLEGAPGRHLVTGPNLSTKQVLGALARHTPGRCTVVTVPYLAIRFGVKPAMDLLHRAGISPVPGEPFVERGDYGTVPGHLTEQAPVRQASWETAIADTVDWYDAVGLL